MLSQSRLMGRPARATAFVLTDVQSANREAIEGGDFTAEFAHSTLENWQSEFLPLFSFVTSALLIHKPSAESKASDDRMEEALRHIEQKLGTN